jgi:hypothetical protein
MDQVITGLLNGTRKAGDLLDGLADIGISAFARMFSETIRQKLNWETTLSGNLLNDLPALFSQSGGLAQGGFLNSLFGGSGRRGGGGLLSSIFGGVLGGSGGATGTNGLIESLFGAAGGNSGLLGGLFGSPASLTGATGTGIFRGGNPFSFGNLAGGFVGSLIGGGISGALGVGQSKPGQLGGGIGGAVGGLGGGILGGALLGAQFGSFAGPIGAAVGAIIGTIIGGVAGDLFKPGRIATEKKGEAAFFNDVFKGSDAFRKFKVLKEPQVAAGFSAFGDQSNANLALGAIFASGQKDATAGTVKREAGQFLGNLKEQGKTTEEVKAATLELAKALNADLPTAINKTNELVSKGILSNAQFDKQLGDSRKNLAQYGDTSTLTAQQLTDLALKNGNVGSTIVTLNKLYAGAIDVTTGFGDSIDSVAIANGLLATQFLTTAGGADQLNGKVGELAGKVRDGSLSVEEAIQQLNGMRQAAGETQLSLDKFTLNPDKIQEELGTIVASVAEAGKAAEGLGGLLSSAVLGDLSTLGADVDKFFKDLFGQQVLGTILTQSLASLKIQETLAPIFEKVLRAQSDFASGALNQDQFRDTIKGILADAGPDIEKIKSGLLAAGESGRAVLDALGLLPETAKKGADGVGEVTKEINKLQERIDAAAASFSSAFDNLGSNLTGGISSFFDQQAARAKQIADLRATKDKVRANEFDIGKRSDSLFDLDRQIKELEANNTTVGQSLGNQIADNFATAFSDGLTRQLVETNIIEAALAPTQQKLKDKTKEFFADGVLTAQEQADLANIAAEGVNKARDAANDLTPALEGINAASKNIAAGTKSVADNFKDIVFPAETAAVLSSIPPAVDKLADIPEATKVAADDMIVIQENALLASTSASDLRDHFEEALDAARKITLDPVVADAKSVKQILESIVLPTLPVVAAASRNFALGGPVGGSGSGDSVHGLLDPREFVMTPQATAANYATLVAMNKGAVVRHFAEGGSVADVLLAQKNRRPNAQLTPKAVKEVLDALEQTATTLDSFKSIEGIFNAGVFRKLNALAKLPPAFFEGAKNAGRAQARGALEQEAAGFGRFRGRVADTVLAPARDFLGQGASAADPLQAIKDQYQSLVGDIRKNRPFLESAGKDVDGLLSQLATELPKKLRQAFEDANRGLIDATAQLGNTAAGLLTGASSPLSAFDKQALLETQASGLRGRLTTASTDELPQILQELSGVLQEQLQLSPFDRFSEDFRSQFFGVVTELKQLQNQTQARIDAAVEAALRVAQPVNLTVNVPSGDPALIENVIVKSIQESSGKVNRALRARRT